VRQGVLLLVKKMRPWSQTNPELSPDAPESIQKLLKALNFCQGSQLNKINIMRDKSGRSTSKIISINYKNWKFSQISTNTIQL
jgi:hypothetical protein